MLGRSMVEPCWKPLRNHRCRVLTQARLCFGHQLGVHLEVLDPGPTWDRWPLRCKEDELQELATQLWDGDYGKFHCNAHWWLISSGLVTIVHNIINSQLFIQWIATNWWHLVRSLLKKGIRPGLSIAPLALVVPTTISLSISNHPREALETIINEDQLWLNIIIHIINHIIIIIDHVSRYCCWIIIAIINSHCETSNSDY